jgi:hypothetical protein
MESIIGVVILLLLFITFVAIVDFVITKIDKRGRR